MFRIKVDIYTFCTVYIMFIVIGLQYNYVKHLFKHSL